MYAIIRTGGKQYRVQAGDLLRVEKLSKNLGDVFDVTDVLMVAGDKTFVGQPVVQNAKVTVVVTQQGKAPKIVVFKKKRRQGYRKMQGHRQAFTELFVKSITSPEGQTVTTEKKAPVFNSEKAEAKKAAAAEQKQTKTEAAPKATAKKAAKKKVAKKAAAKKPAAKKKVAKKATAKKTTKKASSK